MLRVGKCIGYSIENDFSQGQFLKMKDGKLKFAGKANTMGDSNFILESKLHVISAGKVQGQPGTREPPGTFRLEGEDQWRDRGTGTWGEAGPAEENPLRFKNTLP